MNSDNNSFYLDLFSNGSLDIFKENSLTKFSNQLPKSLSFDQPYEVALCSYMIPNNFSISQKGVITICSKPITAKSKALGTPGFPDSLSMIDLKKMFDDTSDHFSTSTSYVLKRQAKIDNVQTKNNNQIDEWYHWTYNIPPEHMFFSEFEFIDFLNRVFKGEINTPFKDLMESRTDSTQSGKLMFPVYFELLSNGLVIRVRDNDIIIILDSSLARILGFPVMETQSLVLPLDGIYKYPILHPDISASIPKILHIYCDVIEPIITANVTSPLLKVVKVDINRTGRLSEVISRDVIQWNYLPVNKKSIQTITIEIRDSTGKPARFLFGLVYLRLHFRPVKH